MNDERLRQLYGRGMAGRDARSELVGACAIAPERLLALIRRELPEAEQLDLLDEVMSSRACREAFELLRVVEAVGRESVHDSLTGDPVGGAITANGGPRLGGRASGDGSDPAATLTDARPLLTVVGAASAGSGGDPAQPGAGSANARRPWWRRNGASVALAASALIAVGLFTWDRSGTVPEATRGAGDGVTLVAPATRPAVGDDAANFVWRAVPGATDYEFELLDAAGEPLHQATTSDTVMAWPADVALLPGIEYRWLVRARTPAGERSSPARQLRIPAR